MLKPLMTENCLVHLEGLAVTVVHGLQARMDELAEQLAQQLQVHPVNPVHETDEIYRPPSWASSPTIPASFHWLDGPELQKEPGILDSKILDLSH